MHSPIAATALLEPIPRLPIPPKSAARFVTRAFCALLRFPTRTVRKPQAVVALATIEPSRTGEKQGRGGNAEVAAPPLFHNPSFCDSCRGRSSRWHPDGHPIAGLYLSKARAWHR